MDTVVTVLWAALYGVVDCAVRVNSELCCVYEWAYIRGVWCT